MATADVTFFHKSLNNMVINYCSDSILSAEELVEIYICGILVPFFAQKKLFLTTDFEIQAESILIATVKNI